MQKNNIKDKFNNKKNDEIITRTIKTKKSIMKAFFLLTLQHIHVSIISNGEEMRRHLVPTFSLVLENDVLTVDWQPTIWVDGDAEET